MRRGRTAVWVLAAASFALAAWLILPLPEREPREPCAPAHLSVEEALEAEPAQG